MDGNSEPLGADSGIDTAVSKVETGSPLPLAARLREARATVAHLEQQQRDELVATIAASVPAGYVFSARELFDHRLVSPELRQAFEDGGIHSVRQLGKRLRQLSANKTPEFYLNVKLERVGDDHGGALWMIR